MADAADVLAGRARWAVLHGRAEKLLPSIPDCSFDAVVTDPPAGIAFMGKAWDSPGKWRAPISPSGLSDGAERLPTPTIGSSRNPMCRNCRRHLRGADACRCDAPAFDEAPARIDERRAFIAFLACVMAECLRVTRPGGVALVWALPRTSHWTATACEDAGWRIEDRISHIFGTGFPKHKSRLKPACEDWWLCRKPGPAWLGVEEGRVAAGGESLSGGDCNGSQAHTPGWDRPWRHDQEAVEAHAEKRRENVQHAEAAGRWPAHVAFSHHPACRQVGTRRIESSSRLLLSEGQGGERASDYHMGARPAGVELGYADKDGKETVEAWECHVECPIRLLDEQSGDLKSGGMPNKVYVTDTGSTPGWGNLGRGGTGLLYADQGGASRFFYCAKASGQDREGELAAYTPCLTCGGLGTKTHKGENGRRAKCRRNAHPTVKNTDLMEWLVKLACPLNGVLLDAFAGSGSTILAAVRAGRRAVGIEQDADSHRTASLRIVADAPLFNGGAG